MVCLYVCMYVSKQGRHVIFIVYANKDITYTHNVPAPPLRTTTYYYVLRIRTTYYYVLLRTTYYVLRTTYYVLLRTTYTYYVYVLRIWYVVVRSST